MVDGSWLKAQGSWLMAHGQEGVGLAPGPGSGPALPFGVPSPQNIVLHRDAQTNNRLKTTKKAEI